MFCFFPFPLALFSLLVFFMFPFRFDVSPFHLRYFPYPFVMSHFCVAFSFPFFSPSSFSFSSSSPLRSPPPSVPLSSLLLVLEHQNPSLYYVYVIYREKRVPSRIGVNSYSKPPPPVLTHNIPPPSGCFIFPPPFLLSPRVRLWFPSRRPERWTGTGPP